MAGGDERPADRVDALVDDGARFVLVVMADLQARSL
jgi:hypothetical protein